VSNGNWTSNFVFVPHTSGRKGKHMATIESIIAQLEHYREEVAAKLQQADAMLAAARKEAGKKTVSGSITCELCGKTFQAAGALGSHKTIVHGMPGTSPGTIGRRRRQQKLIEESQQPERREPETRERTDEQPYVHPGHVRGSEGGE
jgi:hypothetical protein